MWNEGSVLRLDEDNFKYSKVLVLFEEVGFYFHCNEKLLDNQLGSVQNDRIIYL